MKSIVLSLLFVASLSGCSAQSGSGNLSQDIIGCWEVIDVQHIVESNSSEFDQYAIKEKEEEIKEGYLDPYIAKYINGNLHLFKEDTGKEYSTHSYYIEGDSLHTKKVDAGGYRIIKNSSKIRIENDTLFGEVDVISEIESIQIYVKISKIFDLPKDFEIKKAVRRVKMVRLKDCSQYQENQPVKKR